MGYRAPLLRVGTYEDFCSSQLSSKELFKIENSEIFIGSDGSFNLITDRPWVEYLSGRSSVIPAEKCDINTDRDLSPYAAPDDEELEQYLTH